MKFLVIGDSCTDKFVYGQCDRICPEAPVPVFIPIKEKTNGGMAKNVQANVEAMGIDWMGWSNLKEAVPPLYTQHIAECFLKWKEEQ